MNKRIKKYRDELKRNELRISELKARNKELGKLILKEEDLEIIGTFRSLNMTVEELMELLNGDTKTQLTAQVQTPSESSFEASETIHTDKGEVVS